MRREAAKGADGAIDRELNPCALTWAATNAGRPAGPERLAAHMRWQGAVPAHMDPSACILE